MIENVPYNVDPALICLAPGAADGLRGLHAGGFRLFVISNQSGVARGYFAEKALRAVHARLRQLFDELNVPLEGFYYCPHDPAGTVPRYAITCGCRKPQPGMITAAAHVHRIALDDSWFIGDILDDIEAGRRAGCRTLLIDNGNETEWRRSPLRSPDLIARNMAEAARLILSDCPASPGILNDPIGACP